MRNFMKNNEGMCKCPLMGASNAIALIDGAYMLIIGTVECTAYTKATLSMKYGDSNCFSVVLDNNDVTFGSVEKVEKAIEELFEDYQPKSLFVITTCVVEITGDDFSAIIKNASEKYSVPIHLIQTNDFKGYDESYGFELVSKVANVEMPNKFEMMMKKMKQGKNMSREEKMAMMKKRMGGEQ